MTTARIITVAKVPLEQRTKVGKKKKTNKVYIRDTKLTNETEHAVHCFLWVLICFLVFSVQ